MPTADVNGQTLYYEVHGEGEPLLCVMGLAADTLAWLPQVPAFSAAHRTVIFDNRDVGPLVDGRRALRGRGHGPRTRSRSPTRSASSPSTWSAAPWAARSPRRWRSPPPSGCAR